MIYLKKLGFIFFLISLLFGVLQGKENITISFKELTTQNFIKIVSKAIQKDILITSQPIGKVDFASNTPITKNNILDILRYDLTSKGFVLLEKEELLLVVKKEDLSQYEKNPIQAEHTIEVVTIKNSEAKLLFHILEDIISNQQYEQNLSTPSISLDDENNRLILMGSYQSVAYLLSVIKKLDIDQQQVYVQAKIIEISETKTQNIGLQYGLNGFHSTGSSLNTFSSSLNSIGNLPPLSLTQLSGYGYSPEILKSAISLGVTINLLKENKALEVVSEPSILCINNKESSIYVGETRSIPTGTTVGTTTTTNYQREDIGLRLSIKPRLSSEGKVTLQISTTIEDVKLSSVNSDIPDTNKKEVLTTAIVNNGENVIIGGLIKNKLENSEYKVPVLGEIPLLGGLFRSDYEYEDKINLVIVVTPYIIPQSKDLTYITNQLAQLKLIEENYTQKIREALVLKSKKETKNDTTQQEYIDKMLGR